MGKSDLLLGWPCLLNGKLLMGPWASLMQSHEQAQRSSEIGVVLHCPQTKGPLEVPSHGDVCLVSRSKGTLCYNRWQGKWRGNKWRTPVQLSPVIKEARSGLRSPGQGSLRGHSTTFWGQGFDWGFSRLPFYLSSRLSATTMFSGTFSLHSAVLAQLGISAWLEAHHGHGVRKHLMKCLSE